MILNKLTLEEFKTFNYILYDQYVFRSILDVYDQQKIKYKLLAINVFKEREIAPILIQIDSMNPDLLEDYYYNIYLLEQAEYLNKFDQMSLVQNLIKTDLDIDNFAQNLTNLMLINKNIFFRYYDPRVLINIFMLRKYQFLDRDLSKWAKAFYKNFEFWNFELMGRSFQISTQTNQTNIDMNVYSKIKLTHFDVINEKTKEFARHNSDFESIVGFIEKQYLDFEVKKYDI